MKLERDLGSILKKGSRTGYLAKSVYYLAAFFIGHTSGSRRAWCAQVCGEHLCGLGG